jgi:hypothetical protein
VVDGGGLETTVPGNGTAFLFLRSHLDSAPLGLKTGPPSAHGRLLVVTRRWWVERAARPEAEDNGQELRTRPLAAGRHSTHAVTHANRYPRAYPREL